MYHINISAMICIQIIQEIYLYSIKKLQSHFNVVSRTILLPPKDPDKRTKQDSQQSQTKSKNEVNANPTFSFQKHLSNSTSVSFPTHLSCFDAARERSAILLCFEEWSCCKVLDDSREKDIFLGSRRVPRCWEMV
jgi:hypothetical protein